VLRKLQQVQRPLDVDLVRGDRREFGSRRQQRRQVEDAVDLELGEHPLEQADIGNRSGELAGDARRQRRVERADVECDDRRAGFGEPRDEAVADLAAGPGDQNNRFTHSAPSAFVPALRLRRARAARP
jgi:hypothetical protein